MVGYLTRDVELKYLPSGGAVSTIGLATNRRYKRQDGSQADETCFVDVKLYGRTAEVANQYLRKGSRAGFVGRLAYETWTDKQGINRSRHLIQAEELEILDNQGQTQGQTQGQQYQQAPQYQQVQTQAPAQQVQTQGRAQVVNMEQKFDAPVIADGEVPF